MKKEEVTYLVDIKMRDGKSHKQAYEEINRDREFLKGHKERVREAKREIKDLEKQKKQLRARFDKDFKKMINQQKKVTTNRTNNGSASTKHLSRILNYLKEFPESGLNNIAKENCMTTPYVNDGLRFLIKLNKVQETQSPKGQRMYSLK